jgi:L-alanine-DL-glutamate epimerase-like enolase superfamily enzyme
MAEPVTRSDRTARELDDRRGFLKSSVLAALFTGAAGAAGGTASARSGQGTASLEELEQALDAILKAPVLDLSQFKEPITIQSIELLKQGNASLLRTRSKQGVEAITVPHQGRIGTLHPILNKNVVPAFLGQDARDIENLIWEAYRHADNYKLQGLALWVCMAAVEMGLLELMCKTAGIPVANLFGGRLRDDIAVYHASGVRGNTPEAEIESLQSMVHESGAKAIKFRLGGRMSRDADSLPGRSEALIPLARKAFGDSMTLYADSNSSYSPREAIRIGRLMEANGYGFFEEPCEFDDLWGTKQVADELSIPVAGGEQEFSLHRWKWAILHRGLDIVQPDLHYGGGFLRAATVARMAEAAGLPIVPHMSGGGMGYVEVVHFASFVRNAGPFMEYKGGSNIPIESESSTLKPVEGVIRCPNGVGFGVRIPKEFVDRCTVVA